MTFHAPTRPTLGQDSTRREGRAKSWLFAMPLAREQRSREDGNCTLGPVLITQSESVEIIRRTWLLLCLYVPDGIPKRT